VKRFSLFHVLSPWRSKTSFFMFSSPLSADQREVYDRTDGIAPLKLPVGFPIGFPFSAAELDVQTILVLLIRS
jgi:hypothetical protein